ncbi:hypothetical protein N5C81_27270 [Rhizobium pusense]|uniref:hypothetical protein n=1 Tax=Agrobacterium pusense TaxID=648995 RepID=UPI00244B72CC|nr:hypothetical protein [Agrobacterium pusense]MDH1271302.1 hypothetical protein [Agrobacterium pusense]
MLLEQHIEELRAEMKHRHPDERRQIAAELELALAELPIIMGHPANTVAIVYNDPMAANNAVTVSGKVPVNPAALGVFITRFSFPVSSDFTANSQLGGVLRDSNGDVTGIVLEDAADACAYVTVTGTATVAEAKNCFYRLTCKID